MPRRADHPSREELSAYSLGQLPEERAVAIDSHISECEPCCETIVALSSEDTFAGLLQEAGRLPTDQTVVHDTATANSASSDDIPQPLSEHPRYEILGLIGKGGMGDVYQARHRKMERSVALKVINRGLFQKTEAIDRFHREVKAAAQLSHPNIVTAYDADQAGDFHFMVMEYVDGVDLSRTVKDRGALPVADACDRIRQAALGLQHAHERGMVHRDIKPHNLMVTADGTIKILDFGLASLAPETVADPDIVAAHGELTAVGAIMGTPDFISPEQAKDARQADIRSDIYSLGATLYYLLAGRVPFGDGSVTQKLKNHAQVEPAPLNSVRDDVPEKLVAIATKMMAKDPDERYLTPKEVADALESFLRTWQPGEENPPRQDDSSGGNNSRPDGQEQTADDSNPSRLPMVAKFLLYTSLLPIGLCVLNEFVPLGMFNSETDWFWYSTLISLVLGTIGGTTLGIHRGISSIHDGQRVNGKSTDHTLLIILCFGVSAFIFLNRMSDSNGHLEITPQSDSMTLGTHPLTIVDSSGENPLGGTSSTRQDDASGITTHSFKSANGRYNITLVDKVLSVNGERYTLENPTDAIRIVDDRVEITRVMAGPGNGQPSVRENAQVSGTFPTLQIMRVEEESTNLGNDVKRTWKLQGRGLYMVVARILHISDGERRTAYQTKLELNDAGLGDRHGQLVLHSQHRSKDQVALSLDLSFGNDHGESTSGPVSFAKGLGLSSKSSQSLWDAQHIGENDVAFLLTQAQYPTDAKGGTNHRMDDLGAMERLSKQGAEFLVVVLLWEPVGNGTLNSSGTSKPNNHNLSGVEPSLSRDRVGNRSQIQRRGMDVTEFEGDIRQLQGAWKTVSLTESGKQLAAEDGFGSLLLHIKGHTFAITERKPNGEESKVDTGRIEIDSTTSPKTIDFIGRDQSTIGIYEFKDGVLRICLVERGGTDASAGQRIPDTKLLKRPTTFESPAGSNMMLMEFTENEPARGDDIPNIQGAWQVTYSEDGGRITPQEMLKELRFVFDEKNLTTEIGGRKSVAKYKLDPSTNPKFIDLTENGRTKQGIYDLVGDTLRICIAESAEHRPTAFDSQPNSVNEVVLILKRVKPSETSSEDTDDQLHAGLLSPQLARFLIPKAASISNEDFQKLQTNPTGQSIENKSLSLVLLTLDISSQSAEDASDFKFLVEGFPQPSEIAAAMSPSRSKGYFSLIQPDYITECKITNSTDDIARGKVTFNAPKLYIGSAVFEARKHEGKWRIESFDLASRRISIVLGEDGNWNPEGERGTE